MAHCKTFLVVDSETDGRVLIVRTLLRVFPQCAIAEAQEFEAARKLAESATYDAIICHRAIGTDAETLIRTIRSANLKVPILGVSGIDRSKELLAAGATRFLMYDEWLRAGTVVGEILSSQFACET